MAEFHTRIIGLEEAKEDIVALQNRVFQMEEEMTQRAHKEALAGVECRINELECSANYAMDVCSYLEEKVTPSSIIGDLNEELKLLAEYKALGSPDGIKNCIENLKKEKAKLTEERDAVVSMASDLSRHIDKLARTTFSIEYVKTEVLDMINNYEERTAGVALSESGTSHFFYVLALSGLMNIFVEREKELNG